MRAIEKLDRLRSTMAVNVLSLRYSHLNTCNFEDIVIKNSYCVAQSAVSTQCHSSQMSAHYLSRLQGQCKVQRISASIKTMLEALNNNGMYTGVLISP